MIKTLKLGLISLSAFAVLTACREAPENIDQENDPVEQASDGEATSENTTEGILNMDFAVSFDQAVQTFHDTFGENANINEINLDSDRNAYEYNILGWDDTNEYDIEIDAETGDIKEQDTEAENDNDQDGILDLDNIITPQEAMDTAAQDAGSDYVEDWKLEIDDGLTVYEIGLENDNDVKIDATTGDIVDR